MELKTIYIKLFFVLLQSQTLFSQCRPSFSSLVNLIRLIDYDIFTYKISTRRCNNSNCYIIEKCDWCLIRICRSLRGYSGSTSIQIARVHAWPKVSKGFNWEIMRENATWNETADTRIPCLRCTQRQ